LIDQGGKINQTVQKLLAGASPASSASQGSVLSPPATPPSAAVFKAAMPVTPSPQTSPGWLSSLAKTVAAALKPPAVLPSHVPPLQVLPPPAGKVSLPVIASVPQKPAKPASAFGAAEWAAYLGEVGAEPPLPAHLASLLSSPCPFWPGKRVEETHLLCLIPATVNGRPLTLMALGELVQAPKKAMRQSITLFRLALLNKWVSKPPLSRIRS
jgi:hypothetical protein